ncbi:MAG: hypothetical protein MI976_03715 [Pseudomonadales bacterium]|nr:hypothetical protein [Pseudomonadales bacterium]
MAAETAQANKWIDRGTTVVCVVLVVAICYLIIKTVFMFVDDQFGSQPPKVFGASGNSRTVVADNGPTVDPTAIPLWNLFGKEGLKPKPEKQPAKDVDAPVTNLQLVLHGVFVSAGEEDQSTAIISEKRRESKLYHVGDKVPGNATLAGVHGDRVLLNRQGRLEALYFPENTSSGSRRATSSSRRASSKSTSRSRIERSSRSSRTSKGSSEVAGKVEKMIRTASSPTEVARALQEELGINPADALKEMGLETNNGRGYKITGSGSPIFSAIGGKPGDVILSINGRSLGDPATDLGMAEELMADCNASFTMERDGVSFTNKLSLCPK